ncbi:MAG: beta-ketoacyl synthase N-terminal-like domain-containing protein [bacterium]|nr:beta-ketoacyl synthase N-terminal-like domain-containing protein [bacterium]
MGIFIAGGGMTRFGKRAERMQLLMEEAAAEAFDEARPHGITREDVDSVVVGMLNPAEFLDEGNSASLIADHLGLTGAAAWRVETASSTGAAALQSACLAILSGRYETVLVLGGEKESQQSTSDVTARLARMIDRSERQMGATMVALAALVSEYYRRQRGIGDAEWEDLRGRIAVKNRGNGAHNPYAQFRRPITLAHHAASRFVSTPLRLFDCGPISDGATAMLLTSRRAPHRIAGLGHATDTQALSRRRSMISFEANRRAARAAYRMAGAGPGDMDIAEVHDAFTVIEIFSAEDLGLFPPGGYGDALRSGRIEIGGALPVNASGGLISRGHPIGASGLAQVVELHRQLGRDGIRAGQPPRRGIALSMGGLATNNLVTIIESEDAPPPEDTPPPPEDASAAQGWVPIGAPPPRRGVIRAATTLHTPPAGFDPPLYFGLAEGEAEHGRRTVLVRAARALAPGEEIGLVQRPDGLFAE